jgi:hypothetical protein
MENSGHPVILKNVGVNEQGIVLQDSDLWFMSESEVVIRVENVSKLYRLGEVGTGSLAYDVNRFG